MNKELTKISKYLSFILRHKPDEIGLELDANGWGSIEELISKTTDFLLTKEIIDIVVQTNDKQRFALNDDRTRIRANQGHSINIDIDLPPMKPPQTLIHGTAERFWSSIEKEGLKKGQRHHVHLTESSMVAKSVGGRYGKPVLIEIRALEMHNKGYEFYKTANGVWLVETVPCLYLRKI